MQPEVNADVLRELENLAPMSERVSSLKLVWDAKVRRWIIFQVFPQYITPSLYLTEDQKYVFDNERKCFIPDARFPLQLNRASVTSLQWQVFTETGCFAQPFWVVQGEHGGHKYAFSRVEQNILRLNGLSPEAPAPGELPYAPFDMRVIQKLQPLDKLRKYNRMLDYCQRNADQLEDDEREAEKLMRSKMWAWLETQAQRAIEESGINWGAIRSDAPEGDRRFGEKYDQAKHDFINEPSS